MRYVCNVCGWVYDEDEQGVKWEDLPEDFLASFAAWVKTNFRPKSKIFLSFSFLKL